MKNQIIIHAAANQTRVALIENGELAQLFIESPENQRTVGNIYLAEVHKVMAGIRAAFIDLGTQKDAFLHFSDTGEHLENYLIMLNGKQAVQGSDKKSDTGRQKKSDGNGSALTVTEEQNRAGALLAPKQKVLVQIVKEPIGSKGPRVSTNITLAGRFLVLIPMGEYVAVSKRIRSHKERRRLRSCVSSVLPDGFGVIVRTLAEGQKEETIHNDLKDVLDKWNAMLEKLKEAKPPSLLHRDMDMTESLIRDLFAKDYSRILIDDIKIHRSIKSYISRVAPNMVPNIELYKGSEHIFDYMKISRDVDSIFSPRVKMPSGGYLIFEQTEAMYVVDVNSGRYAAKREQEENSLKTNLESAREIAKQLRLRDIGGIIVVDFIDLREESNRKKVFDELKREFRKDRAKTNILPMSDFGLVQITRQRIRPSVVKSVSKVCPMCGGSGSIVSENTIISDIESWLTKFKYNYKGHLSLDLHLNPYLRSMMQKGWISQRMKWLLSYRLNVNLLADDTLSMNDYKFMLPESEINITDTVLKDQPLEKAIKETDLADEDIRDKKKDDPGLDYFKKEDKREDDKSASRRGGAPSSPKKSGGGKKQSQYTGKKTASDSQNSRSSSASKTESDGTVDKPAEGKSKSRSGSQSGKRPNTKAKYYKSSAESSTESTPDPSGKENTSTKSNDKPVASPPPSGSSSRPADSDTQSSDKTPDKSTANPSASAPADSKEDNSHLPSAIEVARQHRLEKEQEMNSNTGTSHGSKPPATSDSTAKPESKPDAESESEATPTSKATPASKVTPKPEPDSKSESVSEPESKSTSKPESTSVSESTSKSEPTSVSDSTSESESTSESKSGNKSDQ